MPNPDNEPHAQREPLQPATTSCGWLNNGNPPYDLRSASRCGARTRSSGECQQPAMANGRCRLHGGKSTGPRTAEGLEKSRKARHKHGYYSREFKEGQRMLLQMMKTLYK